MFYLILGFSYLPELYEPNLSCIRRFTNVCVPFLETNTGKIIASVVTPLVVIIVIASFVIFWKRHHKKRRPAKEMTQVMSFSNPGVSTPTNSSDF